MDNLNHSHIFFLHINELLLAHKNINILIGYKQFNSPHIALRVLHF